MARGAEAKDYVEAKIKEAFGDDFIGTIDKKVYVWAYEGGEKIVFNPSEEMIKALRNVAPRKIFTD